MKGRSAGGSLLAKMLPTFEKCLFKILGIREESLVSLLLLLFIIVVIVVVKPQRRGEGGGGNHSPFVRPRVKFTCKLI